AVGPDPVPDDPTLPRSVPLPGGGTGGRRGPRSDTVALPAVSLPKQQAPLRPEHPRPQPLAALAGWLGVTPPAGNPTVTGITPASGQGRPGDLSAALPGRRTHGARFAREAVAAGAVAVLTDLAGRPLTVTAGVPVLVVRDPRAVLGTLADQIYGEPTAA